VGFFFFTVEDGPLDGVPPTERVTRSLGVSLPTSESFDFEIGDSLTIDDEEERGSGDGDGGGITVVSDDDPRVAPPPKKALAPPITSYLRFSALPAALVFSTCKSGKLVGAFLLSSTSDGPAAPWTELIRGFFPTGDWEGAICAVEPLPAAPSGDFSKLTTVSALYIFTDSKVFDAIGAGECALVATLGDFTDTPFELCAASSFVDFSRFLC